MPLRYARNGKVTLALELEFPQRLEVTISDAGSGIPNLDEILEGRYRSETGLGMGIVGTKRLMDEFVIAADKGGTTVRMAKHIPHHQSIWTVRMAEELNHKMLERAPEGPYEEIEQQNQELLKTLQELRARQELELLNRELEDTNRGVVALYAELDERADYLRRAGTEKQISLQRIARISDAAELDRFSCQAVARPARWRSDV